MLSSRELDTSFRSHHLLTKSSPTGNQYLRFDNSPHVISLPTTLASYRWLSDILLSFLIVHAGVTSAALASWLENVRGQIDGLWFPFSRI
jgi:hypothetical protein